MENKPQIIFSKLTQNFEKRGYINLEQKEVNSTDDLVEIASIFNSPRYESFEIVYLNGNKIKGYETLTTYNPSSVDFFKNNNKSNTKRFYYKVNDRKKRLNADSYYLIHNHPTGISTPSEQDLKTTKLFSTNVEGFKGHIVIGDNNYSLIDYNDYGLIANIGQFEISKNELSKVSEKLEKFYNKDSAKFTDLNFIENYKISSRNELVALVKTMEDKKKFSKVILANAKNKVNMIMNIPNKMLNMNEEQLKGYFRNLCKINGATKVFMATDNKEIAKKSLKHFKAGTFFDLIYYKKDKENSKKIVYVEAPQKFIGRSIFEKPRVDFGVIKLNSAYVDLSEHNSKYFDSRSNDYLEIQTQNIDDLPPEKYQEVVEKLEKKAMENNKKIKKVLEDKEKERLDYEKRLYSEENDYTEPKKGQVRIILKRVGKPPLIKVINNTLEEKQKLVGGLIEVVDFDDDNLLICNEEGKVQNLEPNLGFTFDYIAGDCFLIGDDYENEGFKSVALKDIDKKIDFLKLHSFNYEKTPSKDKEEGDREL